MFQRLFGGGSKSSTAPISSNATNRTVDAIQKLQEVRGNPLWSSSQRGVQP